MADDNLWRSRKGHMLETLEKKDSNIQANNAPWYGCPRFQWMYILKDMWSHRSNLDNTFCAIVS